MQRAYTLLISEKGTSDLLFFSQIPRGKGAIETGVKLEGPRTSGPESSALEEGASFQHLQLSWLDAEAVLDRQAPNSCAKFSIIQWNNQWKDPLYPGGMDMTQEWERQKGCEIVNEEGCNNDLHGQVMTGDKIETRMSRRCQCGCCSLSCPSCASTPCKTP